MTDDLGTEAAGRAREASESPTTRRARGIVHTPRELARFALRGVELSLREQLGVDGLADPRVCVLDPAVGPGVWLEAALEHVPLGSAARPWLGFDVDGAALDTARALLTPACAARNIDLQLCEANTLGLSSPWPADEVRVIVGNPPWAARSLSRGTKLSDDGLRDFLRDHAGAPLAERRTGVLSDDYVRFYRWALQQARTSPAGALVCFATNASFLDGPVHRGMRARLLETFSHISVLDLGGNALLTRAAGRDENLFGVRVGAALVTLVKTPAARASCVSHASLRGARADKLAQLARLANDQLTAHGFTPAPPLLRFVPTRSAAVARAGFRLDEAFPFHREGVQTNRDALATAHDRDELLGRLRAIAVGQVELVASRHFTPARVREKLARALEEQPGSLITALAYRPLEQRYVCTVAPLCHRPRPELLRAVERSSWALLSSRKDRGAAPFHLFAPARPIADACFLSVRSSCRTRVFCTNTPEGEENVSAVLRAELEQRLGAAVSASDLLAYALAVLASASYRAQAGEALKHDYPRVPWPRDLTAYQALVQAGHDLRSALLEAPRGSLLRVNGDPAHQLRLCDLQLAPEEGRLGIGPVLLEGIPTRAFASRVGHWPVIANFVRSKRTCTLSHVLDVVQRVVLWEAAVECADRAFAAHASL